MPKTPRPRKVMIVSLGCAKNLVDTEVMCGVLATGGYVLTNLADEADILLVNTCSFIADARAEAEREIEDALLWRVQGRKRRLVVAGCLPQRDLSETAARFEGVDLFMGLDDVPRVTELFDRLYKGDSALPESAVSRSPGYIYDSTTPRLLLTPSHYAYVKIAEGCDHGCTFCSIPAIRGRQRSRPIDDILAECRQLSDFGVLELNLIAQDTSRYGADRDDGATLPRLIEAIDRHLPDPCWLRILYTHPRHFDEDLFRVYREADHLVPYVDIPLQHISTPILKRMGRGIDEKGTRRLMDRLRTDIPNVALRTTFLVGFPGETEEDFALLRDFVRDFRFERLGVFAFSPEAGTPAAKMADIPVPEDVAQARRDELMAIQREISRGHNQALVGKTLVVLAEGAGPDESFVGRTAADAPEVDNLVVFTGPGDLLERGFVSVRINAASEYDLQGIAAD